MRINKLTCFGVAIVIFAIGTFWFLASTVLAFPEIPGSHRPTQSLGLDVGNLPPNGSPGAQVKIIEYGNYYDPFSRRFSQEIEPRLRAEYIETGKAVMYWKDFVFPNFPGPLGNTDAANAARCANEQGNFWQYHDLLLNASDPELLDFEGFAEELGLNMVRFSRCLADGRYQALIETSSQNAVREGITAVPTFFINGRMVIGAQPWDEFVRIIGEELSQ